MPAYVSKEHHPAFEEYCETIYELAEDDVAVIQARIADRLGITRPAVSEMIRRMEAEGLVSLDGKSIVLTDAGLQLATTMVRRHRIAERFLTDILGLSWASAHHEAGKWEHVISPEVESALAAYMGSPQTCPHGNPIPGSGYVPADAVALVDVPSGSDFTVSRITEELEFEDGMLEFLETSSIVPGTSGVVMGVSADRSTTTVRIDGSTLGIDSFIAERLLVTV
jgi:DtxR family Mn-dependent transcriptional regulator